MGLFGKLKNILFEDDDELDEMPVYTKEEVEEVVEEPKLETPVSIEPTVSETPRFTNVKRDIDMSFEEDVLGEIPGAFDNIPPAKEEIKEEKPVVPEIKIADEKKSIFPSFDEDEFERLNARINHNESKATQREVVKRVDVPASEYGNVNVRQANNNFSSTTVSEEQKDPDRYKINTGTIVSGKKPFTPSPVISPVYGILDKNYTKEDIVDRKGGLKRERTNKLPIRKGTRRNRNRYRKRKKRKRHEGSRYDRTFGLRDGDARGPATGWSWRARALVGTATARCVHGVESGGRCLGAAIADRCQGRTPAP
ncbi:MAG: hypothetical protein II625_08565 [Bacilli bacterium]|nr:hypothetical protein [Bacilli bacterium]